MDLTLLIFLLVYLAMGLGTLPGFKVDRTGASVVGGVAMLAAGSISAQAAWTAIDYSSLGMLFGLMVVSAAFSVSGFYAWTARRVAETHVAEPVLLAILIAVSGAMAAFLTNDVVAVAMTPLLISVTLSRGLNPIPFLLGFCFAANAGAAATIIGSPQNMIAAQKLHLSFAGVSEIAALPALVSLPIIWAAICLIYRGRWKWSYKPPETIQPSAAGEAVEFSVAETVKAALVAAAVIAAFIFSDWPRELVALSGAGLLLLSRQVSSKDMLKHVDGNLILLIVGLFVVNAAFATTGLPQKLLGHLTAIGIDLNQPLSLFFVSAALSNIVGNNPAVMLLVPYLQLDGDVNALGAALSLGTHFSSNLVVFGSLAGIIVVERAAANGLKISFGEFTRAGALVTLATMAFATVWILLL
ncbi:MAG: transporter [Mesorhizobium sp.]|nr:SLC13 family permease [Mesorhizobium sp.]MBL8579885.1 transporter [Mesorhizobium sp.]